MSDSRRAPAASPVRCGVNQRAAEDWPGSSCADDSSLIRSSALVVRYPASWESGGVNSSSPASARLSTTAGHRSRHFWVENGPVLARRPYTVSIIVFGQFLSEPRGRLRLQVPQFVRGASESPSRASAPGAPWRARDSRRSWPTPESGATRLARPRPNSRQGDTLPVRADAQGRTGTRARRPRSAPWACTYRSRLRHVSKSSRSRPTSRDTASFERGPIRSSGARAPLMRRDARQIHAQDHLVYRTVRR